MKKLVLSVGYADMEKFGRLISTSGWTKTIESLQVSLQAVGDIIVKNNGKIFKYMGDAILFTFVEQSDAVSAAKEIAKYRLKIDSFTVRYFVSIATGEVMEVEFGHSSYKIRDSLVDAHTESGGCKSAKQLRSVCAR